jgi:hypothetical protein
MRKQNQSHSSVRALALAAIAGLALSACGNQKFAVGVLSGGATAPGDYEIPAKVDILLVEDNTASMNEAYSSVQAQMPAFLNQLQNSGWDYRFATLPLVTQRGLSQIMASRYDTNWYQISPSLWLPPFPGAPSNAPGVPAAWFRTPDYYSHFVTLADNVPGLGAFEPGLATLDWALNVDAPTRNFLRSDAMLAVVVVGNGNDTSLNGYADQTAMMNAFNSLCMRSDGFIDWVACPSLQTSTFNYYRDRMLALQTTGKTAAVRFFAAVSPTQGPQCLGSVAKTGFRYMNMAASLGGTSVNLCSQGVANTLSAIGGNLQSQRLSMRQSFLTIQTQPNPSTIKVFKNGVEIPQDPANGWTYIGYSTQFLIDSPALMNQATGYMVRLNGNARLFGSDTGEVQFSPIGG